MICAMETTALHDRMKSMIGKTTFRALGEATNHNPETVRRYMSGQAPSVEFLSALVSAYAVNADWLLTGRGPMDRSEVRTAALNKAEPNELMAAIAHRMEDMCDRIDLIEVFVQTMETRLRGSDLSKGADRVGESRVAEIKANADAPAPVMPRGARTDDDQAQHPAQPTDDPVASRAGKIADALTRRPRPGAC